VVPVLRLSFLFAGSIEFIFDLLFTIYELFSILLFGYFMLALSVRMGFSRFSPVLLCFLLSIPAVLMPDFRERMLAAKPPTTVPTTGCFAALAVFLSFAIS